MDDKDLKCLKLASTTKYWYVRAGKQAKYYTDFKINNYIAVGSDFIDVDSLSDELSRKEVDEHNLLQTYKDFFQKAYLDKIKYEIEKIDEKEASQLTLNTKKEADAQAANSFIFQQQISVGDIVVMPSRGARTLLIGVVLSPAGKFAVPHNKQFKGLTGKEKEYEGAPFVLRRQIFWLKEISKFELKNTILGVQNRHWTITDITKYAFNIQLTLSSFVIFEDKLYRRIYVNKESDISSREWFELQKFIVESSPDEVDIAQKIRVSSPGDIVLSTVVEHWQTIVWIVGILGSGGIAKKTLWDNIIKPQLENSNLPAGGVLSLLSENGREIFKNNKQIELNDSRRKQKESLRALQEIDSLINVKGDIVPVPDTETKIGEVLDISLERRTAQSTYFTNQESNLRLLNSKLRYDKKK